MPIDLGNQAYQPVNIASGFSEAFSRGAGAIPDLSAKVGELLGIAMAQRGAIDRTAMEQRGAFEREQMREKGQGERDLFKISALSAGLGSMSPTMQKFKAEKTFDLMSQVERNKANKKVIANALGTINKIPAGAWGSADIMWKKMFDQNSPVLRDWQNLRSILMDATLMNTAKTKGAISDKEMNLFMEAAAADDLMSIARSKATLTKLMRFMDAEEKAGLQAYQTVFGEPFPVQGSGTGLPKPNAVSDEDWSMLSPAGKAAYYEMMGGEEE